MAAGVSLSSQEFGKDPLVSNTGNLLREQWAVQIWSVFGEHQCQMNERPTSFLGVRVDDHSYADAMWSPRAGLIFFPDDRQVVKLVLAQSILAAPDTTLRSERDTGGVDPETVQSAELRYERTQNDRLDLAASAFLQDVDVLLEEASYQSGGLELEAGYQTDRLRLSGSHGFMKLIDMRVDDPSGIQPISAKPYGFGDDLAHWSNGLTKVQFEYQITGRWTTTASARIYWGFAGAEDLTEYNNTLLADPTTAPDIPSASPIPATIGTRTAISTSISECSFGPPTN